jgi:hypothetical protein
MSATVRPNPCRRLVRMRDSEDGWITPVSLILLGALLAIGGFAVDVAHVSAQRTMLQVTADASAHAALLTRQNESEAEAKSLAIALAEENMPRGRYGDVLRAEAVVFGEWDPAKRIFTPVPNSRSAVQVTTVQRRDNANAIPTFLLQFAGVDEWNIQTTSVYSSRKHPCFFNGILAEGVVDFSSNNTFRKDFCVHSNSFVRLRQNNVFEEGSRVTMPDTSLLDIPNSGLSGNPGLKNALGEAYVELGVVKQLPDTIDGLLARDPTVTPSYIGGGSVLNLNATNIKADSFQSGRVHNVNCNGKNGTLSLTNAMNLENVVIVTNCNVQLGNGAKITDSIIASTNLSDTSISGTSGSGAEASVGRACVPGPGTQIMTLGGMRFPSKLKVNGGQFAAARSITFSAQATIEGSGVSVVAGEGVNWTSNADMSVAFCDEEFENHLAEKRMRMVG